MDADTFFNPRKAHLDKSLSGDQRSIYEMDREIKKLSHRVEVVYPVLLILICAVILIFGIMPRSDIEGLWVSSKVIAFVGAIAAIAVFRYRKHDQRLLIKLDESRNDKQLKIDRKVKNLSPHTNSNRDEEEIS